MGKYQRDKGMRFEREFASLVGGYRVPLSGAMGGEYSGDVKAMGMIFECKVRKDGFKKIYEWLSGADALAIKADRKEALVILTVDNFLRIGKPTKRERELQKRVKDLESLISEKNYDPLSYGNRLQKIRTLRGKTVNQVAKKARVETHVVTDWENNVSRPSLEELIRVVQFLNTSTRYIETGIIETGEARAERMKGA